MNCRNKSGGSMKQKHLLLTIFVLATLLGSSMPAQAQKEITFLAPGPMRRPLDMIIAKFQAKTNYKVKATYGTGLSTRQSVAKGEPLDVTLMVAPFPGAMASPSIIPGSKTLVTSFLMAVAVPKNAPKPDISNTAAGRKSFMSAQSLAFVAPEF